MHGASRGRGGRDFAADEHQRKLFEKRRRDSGQGIRDSGAARREYERRTSRGHDVTDGAEGGHRLVTRHHETNLGNVGESIEDRADESSGDPVCHADPAAREDLKHGARGIGLATTRLSSVQDGTRLHETPPCVERPSGARVATLQYSLERSSRDCQIVFPKQKEKGPRGIGSGRSLGVAAPAGVARLPLWTAPPNNRCRPVRSRARTCGFCFYCEFAR